MIEGTISFIEESLNAYLKDKLKFKEERVISSNLVEQDGSMAIRDENRVVITLVDLDQEASLKNSNRLEARPGGSMKTVLPAINLNLFIMFSCFFAPSNYKEGLKYLSHIILFFQGRPLFTNTAYPQLNKYGIEKLSFEMYHPDYQARNNMWTILGIKYLPSIIYKVKMLSFSDQMVKEDLPSISTIGHDEILNS
jgi:hypothetical protein